MWEVFWPLRLPFWFVKAENDYWFGSLPALKDARTWCTERKTKSWMVCFLMPECYCQPALFTLLERGTSCLVNAKAEKSPNTEIGTFRDNSFFNHSICVTIESSMIRQDSFIHLVLHVWFSLLIGPLCCKHLNLTYIVALLYYVPQLHLLNKLSCVTANWVSGMKSKAMKQAAVQAVFFLLLPN